MGFVGFLSQKSTTEGEKSIIKKSNFQLNSFLQVTMHTTQPNPYFHLSMFQWNQLPNLYVEPLIGCATYKAFYIYISYLSSVLIYFRVKSLY